MKHCLLINAFLTLYPYSPTVLPKITSLTPNNVFHLRESYLQRGMESIVFCAVEKKNIEAHLFWIECYIMVFNCELLNRAKSSIIRVSPLDCVCVCVGE